MRPSDRPISNQPTVRIRGRERTLPGRKRIGRGDDIVLERIGSAQRIRDLVFDRGAGPGGDFMHVQIWPDGPDAEQQRRLAELDQQIAEVVQIFEKQHVCAHVVGTTSAGMTSRPQTFAQSVSAQTWAAEIALAEHVAVARTEARSAAEQAEAERLASVAREGPD